MNTILLTGMLAVLAWISSSCSQPDSPPGRAVLKSAVTPSSPHQQQQEPLLLLDDDDEPNLRPAGMADNHRCEVCHLHLAQEELVLDHARAGIGCAKCHGDSDAHIADESWASGGNGTAPDIMFPKARVNPSCLECHAELSAEFHQPFLAGASPEKHCTDCHGTHRIPNRKCKWK